MKKTPMKKTPTEKKEQPSQLANASVEDRAPRKDPLERLAAHPKSLRCAINAMCYDCNGTENWAKRTRECPMPECPLYNVRPFRN